MSFSLIKSTDEWMTRQKVSLPRPKTFFPSEASVKWIDHHGIERVSGACLRQVWYRINGGFEYKTSPYSEWIFALGKAVEEILVEQWKQMGIWVANNLKFYDPERNISGEVDVVVRDPETGELVVCEVKSFYGYSANKEICGNPKKGIPGRPKTSQLLQTLIYVDLGNKLGLWDYAKMIYYSRDSANRAEFDIRLINHGEYAGYPVINGAIDYRFKMEDVYQRYSELKYYNDNKTLPPRDYEIEYSPETVEKYRALGDISKTAYEAYKKNPKKNPIGSWNCGYCSFKDICWKKDASE